MYEEEMTVIPDCSSVSQLQLVDDRLMYYNLSAEDALLFLVSERYEGTETGYISKCVKYAELSALMAESLSAYRILAELYQLSAEIDDWKQFRAHRLSVVGDIKWNGRVPYVISSINLSDTLINGLSGYPLCVGMDMEFSRHVFNQISATNLYAAPNLYVEGNKLTYDDLIKDYFLSSVSSVGGKMVFNFGRYPECEPRTISIDISSLIDSAVYYRDWPDWERG